jgi:hypothetical protein
MTHRSKHSQSYKPTEAVTPPAHASAESISYDPNQFFAQLPRVLARPPVLVATLHDGVAVAANKHVCSPRRSKPKCLEPTRPTVDKVLMVAWFETLNLEQHSY